MEYIYKITSPSGKSYIGRTKNLNKRLIQHKSEAKTGRTGFAIHKAIKKYTWEKMKVEILDMAPSKEIEALEEHYIRESNSLKIGYNETLRTTGGNVWEGKEDTEEFQQFKEHMSKVTTGENNGMFGRTHSEETRAKMKAKAAGRCSLEWFINKHGKVEGTERYESMMEKRRKNRYAKMKTDNKGKFVG